LGLATKGRIQVDAMNAMSYDAMALGSGDFLVGLDTLRERMSAARFPMLSANAVMSDTGQLIGQPYVLKDLGSGYSAAIVGLTDGDVEGFMAATHAPAIRVLDPIETTKRCLNEIGSKANVIIVLSHLGTEADRELAEMVPGVDVIVGGKSEAVLEPAKVDGSETVVVQAGSQGKYLGIARVRFDSQGVVVSVEGEPLALGEDVPDDPAMVKLIEDYTREVGPIPTTETVID
jgi:2',3'-cyclic-nucleotide 2'-phosphodiesterase (5'-nucleotidase family)